MSDVAITGLLVAVWLWLRDAGAPFSGCTARGVALVAPAALFDAVRAVGFVRVNKRGGRVSVKPPPMDAARASALRAVLAAGELARPSLELIVDGSVTVAVGGAAAARPREGAPPRWLRRHSSPLTLPSRA